MTTLDDLIARAERLADEGRSLARDLRAFRALQRKSGQGALKGPDGKLTEQGVRVLEAGLKSGKTASDIARSLDITVPAVLYRKGIWAKANSKRRSE